VKTLLHAFVPILLALAIGSCREEARLAVLFTGDERGWIVPAG
jgi:hypothetical protein